jgi:hypothetical protein
LAFPDPDQDSDGSEGFDMLQEHLALASISMVADSMSSPLPQGQALTPLRLGHPLRIPDASNVTSWRLVVHLHLTPHVNFIKHTGTLSHVRISGCQTAVRSHRGTSLHSYLSWEFGNYTHWFHAITELHCVDLSRMSDVEWSVIFLEFLASWTKFSVWQSKLYLL